MAPVGKAALIRLEARWARHLRNVLRTTRNHLVTCSSSSTTTTTTHSRYQLKAAAHNASLQQGDHEPSAPDGPDASADASADADADLNVLSLKICILGDCQTGKTSFVTKYVGDEEPRGVEVAGLNKIDKVFAVKGTTIAFNIWDVGGENHLDHVPVACKDSVAILIMFDLTNRCTLNNVISWNQRARRCNKSAIPILIGTKFDEFVQLPLDMQWTIAVQARAYARAMKATLFFSSATHNINVNKIFKFVAARLFNLPWTLERNLNIGEPIIDF